MTLLSESLTASLLSSDMHSGLADTTTQTSIHCHVTYRAGPFDRFDGSVTGQTVTRDLHEEIFYVMYMFLFLFIIFVITYAHDFQTDIFFATCNRYCHIS